MFLPRCNGYKKESLGCSPATRVSLSRILPSPKRCLRHDVLQCHCQVSNHAESWLDEAVSILLEASLPNAALVGRAPIFIQK